MKYIDVSVDDVDELIVIMYYGRSGSYFLQSLLDSHPDLIMLPPGDYLYCHFWDFWEKNKKNTLDTLIQLFVKEYPGIFDSSMSDNFKSQGFCTLGDNQNEKIDVSRSRFSLKMKELLENKDVITRKDFFVAIHLAYNDALGRKFTNCPKLVYQLHTPHKMRVQRLIDDFRNIKFIQMLRNPMTTLGSHFAMDRNLGVSTGAGLILWNYEHAFPPENCKDDCVRGIKLEELHTNPREVMSRLAEWLGIEWNESLLSSTFVGKLWWNLKGTQKLNGFSTQIINKRYDHLYYPLDILRFDCLYAKRNKHWGYTQKYNWNSIVPKIMVLPFLLFPFKLEVLSWKSIFKNKAFSIIALKDLLKSWINLRGTLIKAWRYSFQLDVRETKLL